MVSQPSGNKTGEIVTIETSKLYFTIKSKGKNKNILKEREEDTFKYICYDEEKVELSENIEKVIFYEYDDYEVVIENKENHHIEFFHENKLIRNSVTPTGKSGRVLSGIINFKGDIGYTELIILVDNKPHLEIAGEVYPSKLDYKEDYKNILADVNKEIYNLAYDFLKRTYLKGSIDKTVDTSYTEFFSIMSYIYKKLIKSINIILSQPHHSLKSEDMIYSYHKIKSVDSATIKWLEKRPENLIKKGYRYIPTKALQIKKRVTYDTNENRFLKFMILSIADKIDNFKKKYKKLQRKEDELLLTSLDKMKKELKGIINRSFLRDVGKFTFTRNTNSLVFTMASGYRDVYKYYLMLQKGLTSKGEVFRLSIKELSLLYEYWCFIKINTLLRKKYTLVSSDMINLNRKGIFVTLRKGKESKVTYENPQNGQRFTISYNPKKQSKTVPQKPDNVLSIIKQGTEIQREFILDAKYKIDTGGRGTSNKVPGPKEEDINTMHRYRDAIVYENKKTGEIRKTIEEAIILFPYKNEEEYMEHLFFKSIDKVGIGGLPFLPSATELVEEFLEGVVN